MNSFNLSQDVIKSVALRFAIVALVAQAFFVVGGYISRDNSNHMASDLIKERISLDLATLDVGSETLNTPINESSIYAYMVRINHYLDDHNYPAQIHSIQGVTFDTKNIGRLNPLVLATAEQKVNVVINYKAESLFSLLGFSPLLVCLLLVPVLVSRENAKLDIKAQMVEVEPEPDFKLEVNLIEKSITNGVCGKQIPMQNKPLCFYVALVNYCVENPNASLLHHKDVPEDLVSKANKVFSRLIELGHTKRKRPDFNANLDKTLSEIRAALDEVFESCPAEKDKYYPPRAQGEGSRSKQHSYALTSIEQGDVEIIGR